MDAWSRYRLASGVTDEEGDLILTDPEPFTTPLADDARVTCVDGQSLNHLAFELYGRAELWWILADRNGIHDPTQRISAGAQLVAPSRRAVTEEILTERRRAGFQA